MTAPRDEIVEMVCTDVRQRSRVGLKKYGRGLDERQDIDLRGWLQQQYEELLDGANYCKCAILRLDGNFPGEDQCAEGEEVRWKPVGGNFYQLWVQGPKGWEGQWPSLKLIPPVKGFDVVG